jgi:cbb3-type cytochrome oxidase subunit 3
MRKVLSYIKVVFASVGAIMLFLDETISRLGNSTFQLTPQQIQQIGLVLFVLAVLWSMISSQAKMNKQEAASPNLVSGAKGTV